MCGAKKNNYSKFESNAITILILHNNNAENLLENKRKNPWIYT